MTFRNLLVPVDFSEPSGRALAYARSLAAQFDATVHLLHVVPNVPDEWLARLTNTFPASVMESVERMCQLHLDDLAADEQIQHASMRVGRPHTEIVEYAKTHNIDLIVMGSHGRSGIAHAVLGSVAEKVVREATCPVLTVRDES